MTCVLSVHTVTNFEEFVLIFFIFKYDANKTEKDLVSKTALNASCLNQNIHTTVYELMRCLNLNSPRNKQAL